MHTLNQKYVDFKNNTITFSELKAITYEKIYFNKSFFGLHNLTEDEFSDFFVYFYPRLDSVILNYNTTLSSFSSYVFRTVMYLNHAWSLKQKKDAARRTTINLYAIEEYHEKVCSQEVPYLSNNKVKKIDLDNYLQKNRQISSKQQIMILALKACYYIKDDLIQSICFEYQIDEDYFYNLISQARQSLDRKIFMNNMRNQRINELYINRKHVLHKLQSQETDAYYTNILSKKYEVLNSLWCNKLKDKNFLKLIPSNKTISDLLNISYYKTRKFISETEKNLKQFEIEK